jgi:hypothetical protein
MRCLLDGFALGRAGNLKNQVSGLQVDRRLPAAGGEKRD